MNEKNENSTSVENLESKEIKNSVDNALNAISLAALLDLFAFSKSASCHVLIKMREFESFNAFLGSAFDTPISDFIPELSFKETKVNRDEQA